MGLPAMMFGWTFARNGPQLEMPPWKWSGEVLTLLFHACHAAARHHFSATSNVPLVLQEASNRKVWW
jgi:hypothetical protein